MLHCAACGHATGQRGTGHRSGQYSDGNASCISDTEYDNDHCDRAPLPGHSTGSRAPWAPRPTSVDNRMHFSPDPIRGRCATQHLAEGSMSFHRSNSFDSESICSGTFTIDLSTLRNIEHRARQNTDHQVNSARRQHTVSAVMRDGDNSLAGDVHQYTDEVRTYDDLIRDYSSYEQSSTAGVDYSTAGDKTSADASHRAPSRHASRYAARSGTVPAFSRSASSARRSYLANSSNYYPQQQLPDVYGPERDDVPGHFEPRRPRMRVDLSHGGTTRHRAGEDGATNVRCRHISTGEPANCHDSYASNGPLRHSNAVIRDGSHEHWNQQDSFINGQERDMFYRHGSSEQDISGTTTDGGHGRQSLHVHNDDAMTTGNEQKTRYTKSCVPRLVKATTDPHSFSDARAHSTHPDLHLERDSYEGLAALPDDPDMCSRRRSSFSYSEPERRFYRQSRQDDYRNSSSGQHDEDSSAVLRVADELYNDDKTSSHSCRRAQYASCQRSHHDLSHRPARHTGHPNRLDDAQQTHSQRPTQTAMYNRTPGARARSTDRSDQGRRSTSAELVPPRSSSVQRRRAGGDWRKFVVDPTRQRQAVEQQQDAATSNAIQGLTQEITQMTHSVNNIDCRQPPQARRSANNISLTGDRGTVVKSTADQSVSGRLAMSLNGIQSTQDTTDTASRQRLKEQKRRKMETRLQTACTDGSEDSSLLSRIQNDLQAQMTRWTTELDATDRLISRTVLLDENQTAGPDDDNLINSALVDSRVMMSDDQMLPKFRATVDVTMFSSPTATINVSLDRLTQKLVVEACTDPSQTPVRTLRQNITLPRFADENNIEHKLNDTGLLEIEVPLLYYFPQTDGTPSAGQGRARAFVYEVRDDPRDVTRRLIEIVVDAGQQLVVSDLRVDVDAGRLVISAERPAVSSRRQQRTASTSRTQTDVDNDHQHHHVIKQYTLPSRADVGNITARRSNDGRLSILVPVRR